MDIWYYLMTPFTFLLKVFYELFNSYGLALVLFALVVKVILFPLSIKGKKSMIQMNMLSGKMNKLQQQYKNNQQKYNEEVQKLYEKEGVNPMGGCLWSFLPILIIFPLYAIIRQPLKYMMGMSAEQIMSVAQTLNWDTVAVSMNWIKPEVVTKAMEAASEAGTAYTTCFANAGYNQMYLASLIAPDNLSAVQAIAPKAFELNFTFLGGINLALQPQLKFWTAGLTWGSIGLFLIPVVSALTSVFFSMITMRTSNMNKDAQNNSTNRMMMLMTPLMSLWIGFAMPAALSVYWVANNVLGMVQELIAGRMLKKDYEAAAEAARQREIDEKEEEKRLRREKAEQRAREAEEARKNKNKKKEKAAEGDKMSPEQKAASRVGMRQYARGRAYDPGRFGGVTPYHDGEATIETTADKPAELSTGAGTSIGPDASAATSPVEETTVETAVDKSPDETTED